MKRYVTIVLLFYIAVLVMGCATSKRGLIEIKTSPTGATVSLNQTEQGITPVTLEYDFRDPVGLMIEKDGYYPEVESLDKRWVVEEFHKGNYVEGRFTIQGKSKKAWKVSIMRSLQKHFKREDLQQREIIGEGKTVNETIEPIEALRKYKELFDEGVITQEDFEKKKRELMGID